MSRPVTTWGSARKGNTEHILHEIAHAAEEEGTHVEMVLLRQADIASCDGYVTCEDDCKCHVRIGHADAVC
jgi:multimeric flavodoxin WrbA